MSLEPVRAARLLLAAAVMAGTVNLEAGFRALWPDSTGHDDHGRGEGGESGGVSLGTVVPDGKVPEVDWSEPPDSAGEIYGKAEKGYVSLSQLDEGMLAEEEDQAAESDDGSYEPIDPDMTDFTRPFPPITVVVDKRGDIAILDGNHRVRSWKNGKFTHAPAWIIDNREAKARGLAEFRALWPDSTGHDDHGRGEGSASGEKKAWPEGLKKIGGQKGSNPGGLHEDASGQKWYVKEYKDPAQAASEQVANDVYRAVGIAAPESVLGEGGQYASKWEGGGKTLAKHGLDKETADRVLDGFAADVLLDNWDAVGTGHDNILVKAGAVTRIDQGGTLLHRAQGAPKPEGGLHKIGEWESLATVNPYYEKVFQAAGVKDADALGGRAVKQIERIKAARPSDGWKGFVDRSAPKAPAAWRAKAASMLESRTALLEKKAAALKGRSLAEFRALWPNAEGHDDHGRDYEQTSLKPLKGRDIREALSNVYPPVVEAYGKVQEIDPREVMSGQKTVNPTRVSEYKNNPDREADRAAGRGDDNRLLVARRNGKLAVIDGNHRIAGALARGATSIKATVIDMDAATADAERGRQSGEGFGLAVINAANRKLRGLADWNEELHPRDEKGKFSDSGGGDTGVVVKQKAAPATKDQVATAVQMKKDGHSYAKIQEATGLNPKQAATIVFKANKKEKELAAQLKAPAEVAIADLPSGHYEKYGNVYNEGGVIVGSATGYGTFVPNANYGKGGSSASKPSGIAPKDAPFMPPLTTKDPLIHGSTSFPVGQTAAGWSASTTMHPNGNIVTLNNGTLQWKEKTTGAKENIGKYAYYDKNGVQVSAPKDKADFLQAAATINQGKGPEWTAPKAAPYAAPVAEAKGFHVTKGAGTAGEWPIDDNVPRAMGVSTPAALNASHGKWANDLPDAEKSAVRSYTGSSYAHINAGLREGGSHTTGTAGKITSALGKAPSPPPPDLVWRGTSHSGVGSVAASLGVGDVVQMNGFQSTSIKPEFANGWGSGKTLFEIKPARGGYVRSISQHAQEYEYILPHGHKYTVAGIKHIKFKGEGGAKGGTHKVIQLEMHK